MDHQISHSKNVSVLPLHIPTIKTNQPANEKANFVLLAVPAHGTHYGLWHWVLLRIMGNLPTLLDFSVLARDLNVVVLKISAKNSNMYSGRGGGGRGCICVLLRFGQTGARSHTLITCKTLRRWSPTGGERGEPSPNFHLPYNWQKARKSQSGLPKNARDISFRRVGHLLTLSLERLADFRYFAMKTPNVFRQP
jgi:hypothetical protein